MGMCALGLALEAMITLLTLRFVPFFLVLLVCASFFICGRLVFKLALGTDTFRIPQIIVNVSTAAIPLELQPPFYQYGVGFQFYHMSVFHLLYATCLAIDQAYNSFLLVK